jgi:hypothetical protein
MENYDPNLAEVRLIPDGEYGAGLKDCQQRLSRKQNPMLVLDWDVLYLGENVFVRDFVVLDQHFGMKRLKHLAKAWGLLEEFRQKKFNPADHRFRRVIVVLGSRPAEGDFDACNVIKDYRGRDLCDEAEAPGSSPNIGDRPNGTANGVAPTENKTEAPEAPPEAPPREIGDEPEEKIPF